MELDEMKNAWQEMSKRIEKQEYITNQVLEKMTTNRYHSKLKKIAIPEYLGTIVCFAGAAWLIFNFTKIEGILMQAFALVAILLLFILPILSLKSVRTMQNIKIASNSYVDTIKDFGQRKLRFQKLQKLNLSLGLFLMLLSLPVVSAIQGKDIGQIPYFWTLIFPIAIVFFLAFSFWALRSYNKILNDTEEMLSDIRD